MKSITFIALVLIQTISVSFVLTEKSSVVIPKLENKYIITLKGDAHTSSKVSVESASQVDLNSHIANVKKLFSVDRSNINKVGHVYDKVLKGYAATLTPEMLEKVKKLPEIKSIQKDGIVTILDTENNAPWGLARVSHRDHLTNANNQEYLYDANAGQGVAVYVVDTGIYINHQDLEGRAVWGSNFVAGQPDEDNNGHGSHCAGTIGSRTYGVAKSVQLVAVKVLDGQGSGFTSDIVAGINWVVGDKRGSSGNVISMSLGGGFDQVLNDAVNSAVSQGVTVVVAAGNSNDDACSYSPASAQTVISVGATDITDTRASFSNYGQCVTLFGPGVNVLSIWNSGPTATNTISGTSMATPHIAGLAATVLTNSSLSPDQVKQQLISLGSPNLVSDPQNSPNIIGFNGYGDSK